MMLIAIPAKPDRRNDGRAFFVEFISWKNQGVFHEMNRFPLFNDTK